MSKVSLTNLVNLQNETTAVNAINANNAVLTTAMEKTLSRDGTIPNTMSSTLDMNSNRIVNLPSAVSSSEPVTLLQMANSILPTGLVGVPVSAAMQPVLNQATTALAQTAMGIPAIGAGLNDTSGVRTVRFPTTAVTTNQTVTSAFHMQQYLATGPITFTLPLASTLYNGFGFWIYAYSGIVTLTPNAADSIQRGTAGASISISAGSYAFITTNGATAWAVQVSASGGTNTTDFNVKSFGATGNGSTDDTTAIQAAINAAQVLGGAVYIPAGQYKITSRLNITSHILMYGDGSDVSNYMAKGTVLLPIAGIDCIYINCQNAVSLRDFKIFFASPPAGTGITLDSTGGGSNGNADSDISNVSIHFAGVGFHSINAYTFNLNNCRIDGAVTYSIWSGNTNVPGSGDSVITNCVCSGAPTAHFFVSAGGGLRIENNKSNGGNYGLVVQPSSTITQGVSPFFLIGNSMEGNTSGGILVQRAPGSNMQMGNFLIANNEVGSIDIQAAPTGTNPWVNQGVISGNFIYTPTGAAISVASANEINITGNMITGLGAPIVGITISGCTRVVQSANNLGLNVT